MNIKKMIDSLDKRELTNTQRVLVTLLSANGDWVARTAMRVPNATSRARELRSKDFGSFKVECASASELKRRSSTPNQTFYRVDPTTVRETQLKRALKGVVASSK